MQQSDPTTLSTSHTDISVTTLTATMPPCISPLFSSLFFFPEMKWTAKKRILLTIPLSNRFLEPRFGRGGKWEGGRVAALKWWWWWGGGLEGVSVCGYGWIVLFGDY